MAGETPDYQRLNVQTTVFPMTDLGELGARLGSIVTYDRRGDILHLDDFENGLAGFLTLPGGVAGIIDLSTARKRSGQFSCRMVAGTGAPTSALIERALPLPALSAVGIEISWSPAAGTGQLELRLDFGDGSDVWRFALRHDGVTDLLAVLNAAGVYTTVGSGIDIGVNVGSWSTMKLVADLNALGYVRGLMNGRTFDLSSFAPQDVGGATAIVVAGDVVWTGDGGAPRTAYVDDYIVTQNEPP